MALPQPRAAVRRIPAYKPGGPQDGTEVKIHLASNENPLGPSPGALAAAAGALTRSAIYPDMAGRDLVAGLSSRTAIAPEQIVLGCGSGHLIKLLCEAYLESGTAVLVQDPTFSLYAQYAAAQGAEVLRVAYNAAPPAIPPNVRLIFLCSPHNPTGALLGAHDLQSWIDALPAECLLVLDEAYVHFAASPPDTLAHLMQGAPIAVLRTFSKAYGLAGMRIGALFAPVAVAQAVMAVREPFPLSGPALAAAVAALEDEAHVERSVRTARHGIATLLDRLPPLGLDPLPSEANFVLARLRDGQSADRLVASLSARGILIRSGSSFGLPQHVRISIGTHEQTAALLHELEGVVSHA